jgi:TonB family protein
MKRAFFAIIALAVVGCSGADKEKKTNDVEPTKKQDTEVKHEEPVVANIVEYATAAEPVAEKPKELKKRPVYDDSVDYGEPYVVEIKDRNIVMVNVSRSGSLMVDDNIYSPRDLVREGEHSRLSKQIYDFLVMEDCSEKRSVEIEPGKSFDLSEGIVSLRVDPEATDEIYSEVYYEIEHAFDLYRNYVAEKLYGKAYAELESEQQNCLRKCMPAKISDAYDPYYKMVIVADDKEIKQPELIFTNDASDFDDFEFDMDVVEEEIDDSEEIFTVLEDPATFQGGGIAEFRKWVMERMKYPQIAIENGIQGNVVIEFVVDEEGKIGRMRVLQSPDPVLSEAAIKVLEDANKLKRGWKPGKQRGKAVKQAFTLPISFRIQN